jgi:3-mercaptopyruvate sulfurtransferase SseA
MLHTYGHQFASVINGGFKKWQAEGRRIETTPGFETPAATAD